MRKYIVFSTCFLLGLACAWAADGPQAKLSEPSHDHGKVFVGAVVKGSFFVENTGTAPFTIVSAKTSCHCTTAVPSTDAIAPGGHGEITYEITTAGMSKAVTRNITISTEPPLSEPLVYSASVTILPYIEADEKASTVEILQGEKVNARVPLHFAEGQEGIKVLSATTRSRDVQVSLEESKDGAPPVLIVQSTNPLPAGKRPVVAELQFENTEKGAQNITVTVNVLPTMQITPAPIAVAFEPGKDEVTIPVVVKNTKGNPFKITSVVAKVCTIREVTLPKEAAAEHTLSITFVRPPAKQGLRPDLRGILSFEFDGDLGKQTVLAVFQRKGNPAEADATQKPAAQ